MHVQAANAAHMIQGLAIRKGHRVCDCQKMCSFEVAQVIIQAHHLSGADFTSGFFGKGKKKVLKNVFQIKECRELIKDLGQTDMIGMELINKVSRFVIKYVYGDSKSQTLTDARASSWQRMKNKSTKRLPPDDDTLKNHLKRVNYITKCCLDYNEEHYPASPSLHGWYYEQGVYRPLRYTKAALPNEFQVNQTQKEQSPVESETEYEDDSNESDESEEEDEYYLEI